MRLSFTRGRTAVHIGALVLLLGLSAWHVPSCRAEDAAHPSFTFSNLVNQARELAEQPFEPGKKTDGFLQEMTYDQWRDIRFDSDQSLWRSEALPFEIRFFHPGAFYDVPVVVDEVSEGETRILPFSKDAFDYGQNEFKDRIPEDLGYAGFRIHYPIQTKDYKDEVAVFLGASYFRVVGKNQQYGLSARGLAVDTGLDTGEEFPFFKAFWLVKPQPKDTHLQVFALLDSPSITGAYAFTVRPGKETVIEVDNRLFPRKKIKKLGIAPLTSMFFYGENTNIRPVDDFRPEVHDSDGLLLALSGGEWVWRPLINPEVLTIPVFQAPNPRGFGLMQRDRNFDHYQDLEAIYHKRPSAWVSPEGDWGKGRIELIQIPTDSEFNDNMVAFWVPEGIPEDEAGLTFPYRIAWRLPEENPHGGGRVISTHTTYDSENRVRTFLIDFQGGRLDEIHPEAVPGEVVTVEGNIHLIEQQVQRNPETGGWRLMFKLRENGENAIEKVLPSKAMPVHVRAFLRHERNILTETWDYSFQP